MTALVLSASSLCLFLLLPLVASETILCDGGLTGGQTCKSRTVSCAADEPCVIRCDLDWPNATEYAICRNTVFACKAGQSCTIRCNGGDAACRKSTVSATTATQLNLVASSTNSFANSVIYCPVDQGACNLTANPLQTDRAFYGMTAMAVHGFDDIQFNCNTSSCLQAARMNCSTDYSRSCLIDYDVDRQNQCIDGSQCGDPTPKPTNSPTIDSNPLDEACTAWQVTISLVLYPYNQSAVNWDEDLQSFCTTAFTETILSSSSFNRWSTTWCLRVAEFQYVDDDALELTVRFYLNEKLFFAKFLDFNSTIEFADQFEEHLLNEIWRRTGQRPGVYSLSVAPPTETSETSTPSSTATAVWVSEKKTSVLWVIALGAVFAAMILLVTVVYIFCKMKSKYSTDQQHMETTTKEEIPSVTSTVTTQSNSTESKAEKELKVAVEVESTTVEVCTDTNQHIR